MEGKRSKTMTQQQNNLLIECMKDDKQDSPTQSTISTPKGICSPPPLVGDATAIKGKPSALVESGSDGEQEEAKRLLFESHAIVGLINQLREDEGNSVEILCDNPDGEPNNGIVCIGDWTGWDQCRFDGNTLRECLEKAVQLMKNPPTVQKTVSAPPVQSTVSIPQFSVAETKEVDWSKVPRGTIVEVGMGGEYVKGFFLRRSKDGHFAVYFLKPFTGTYTIYPCARLPLPLPENRGQQGSGEAALNSQ